MIQLRPFDDYHGFNILSRLDPHDFMEAGLIRAGAVTHYGLFADWRAMQAHAVPGGSWVFVTSGRSVAEYPFAVGMLANTGQAGVAQAALLARDHAVFRVALGRLAHVLRASLPEFCRSRGIHRVEARSWAGHPTAGRLLGALGFTHECDMPGFGPTGRAKFRQWAWTDTTEE